MEWKDVGGRCCMSVVLFILLWATDYNEGDVGGKKKENTVCICSCKNLFPVFFFFFSSLALSLS